MNDGAGCDRSAHRHVERLNFHNYNRYYNSIGSDCGRLRAETNCLVTRRGRETKP